jgi:hypothetical protein
MARRGSGWALKVAVLRGLVPALYGDHPALTCGAE